MTRHFDSKVFKNIIGNHDLNWYT